MIKIIFILSVIRLTFLISLVLIGLLSYLSRPYSFAKLSLQSGCNFITLIIGSMLVTIPASYFSAVKNFGIGFLIGIPGLAIANVAVYMVTDHVLFDDLNGQLHVIFTEADRMLHQLNNFITQFHNFVNQTGINVVTNVQGELGIDVIANLDDTLAQQYANRINVFDSLIHNHIHELESIIERITELEEKLSELDENYECQCSIYKDRLKVLIREYGHYQDN